MAEAVVDEPSGIRADNGGDEENMFEEKKSASPDPHYSKAIGAASPQPMAPSPPLPRLHRPLPF